MVGMATLTTKASTPNMNCADTTIASTHQRRDETWVAETIWCMKRPVRELLPPMISGSSHRGDYPRGKHPRRDLARLLHGGVRAPFAAISRVRKPPRCTT